MPKIDRTMLVQHHGGCEPPWTEQDQTKWMGRPAHQTTSLLIQEPDGTVELCRGLLTDDQWSDVCDLEWSNYGVLLAVRDLNGAWHEVAP